MSTEKHDYRPARSAEFHAEANRQEAAGDHAMAGLLRVEAANIMERPLDWKPIHKPSLGPYSADNPCVCVHCGRSSRDPLSCDFGEGDERHCDQRLARERAQ